MAGSVFLFSGAEVRFLHQINGARHFHQEIELLYVMDGELNVQQDTQELLLKKDDVVLINSNHIHSVSGGAPLALLQVMLPYRLVSELLPDGAPAFYCNSVTDTAGSYYEIRALLRQLLFSCAETKKKSPAMRQSCIYALLDALIEDYRVEEKKNWAEKDQRDEERLQTLINYVNDNFQEQINLGSLAEQMYTSTSSLSRLFKKNMGCYFGDFVNQVRLNYAVQQLESTKRTITKIASECGFTSLAAFNKQFQAAYQTSPTAYRKEHQKLAGEDSVDGGALAAELEQLGITDDRQQAAWETRTINAEINAHAEPAELKRGWNMVLNAGSAYDMTTANVQNHIAFLYEHLKFRYVRIWNPFSTRMMIRSGTDSIQYNFNTLDNVFDFMVGHHMLPYLDFSRRPNCAVSSGSGMVYYEEDAAGFKDASDWERVFYAFFNHLERRYGREELSKWIFDFAMDIRYDSVAFCKNEAETWQLYRRVYTFIKNNLPRAQVGGICGSATVNKAIMLHWLDFCAANACVPDFMSVLLFPYDNGESRNTELRVKERLTVTGSEAEQLRVCRQALDERGMTGSRLYAVEWNNTLSTRNWINDSCARGTYLLNMINQAGNLIDGLGIWMASDWCSSYYDTSKLANGGNGLLTKDGIRKPVYHALAFLNRVHTHLIARGENYFVTSSGMDSYYVLCYNFKWYSYRYFQTEENELELTSLTAMFTDNSAVQMEIALKGLNGNHTYAIKKRTVDPEHGSLIGEWSCFEYDSDLDGRDIEYLRKVCVPELSKHRQQAANGVLRFRTTLKAHEMTLFHIYEEQP